MTAVFKLFPPKLPVSRVWNVLTTDRIALSSQSTASYNINHESDPFAMKVHSIHIKFQLQLKPIHIFQLDCAHTCTVHMFMCTFTP